MRNTSSVLSDVFFGTQQSKYAALAIFITISILCFFILFASSDISLEQRLFVILLIVLTSVPSILFSLFELTCIVTGGTRDSKWWCYWLAWVISFIIIIYCLFIVISMFYSMATYDTAMTRIIETDEENKVSNTDANNYAKTIMHEKQEHAHRSEEPIMAPREEPMMSPRQEPMMSPRREPMMSPRQEQPTNMFNTMGYDANDNYAPFNSENEIRPVIQPPSNMAFNELPMSGNVPEPYVNSKLENLQDFSEISLKM